MNSTCCLVSVFACFPSAMYATDDVKSLVYNNILRRSDTLARAGKELIQLNVLDEPMIKYNIYNELGFSADCCLEW